MCVDWRAQAHPALGADVLPRLAEATLALDDGVRAAGVTALSDLAMVVRAGVCVCLASRRPLAAF